MEKRSVITVRFASGAVEYWYEAAVPKLGDRVGRDVTGFVTAVELDGDDTRRSSWGHLRRTS